MHNQKFLQKLEFLIVHRTISKKKKVIEKGVGLILVYRCCPRKNPLDRARTGEWGETYRTV